MSANIKNLIKNLTKIVKGLNTKSLFFSLSEPNFNNNDKISIKKCIDSTYVSTGSKFTNEFEKKLSRITKSKYVIATNSGAKDCLNLDNRYEIISEKEDFYKVKSEFEKKLDNFEYSGIEWRPINYLELNEEQNKKIIEILESLEELDDVQNIYTNLNLRNI